MSRAIKISLLIIILIILGAAIYFGWQNLQVILNPPDSNSPSDNATTTITIPIVSDQVIVTTTPDQPVPVAVLKPISISDQPIFDYWVLTAATSSKIFYINSGGQIMQVNDDSDEPISSSAIQGLQSIKSSNDGRWVLIKAGEMNNPQFSIFNSETNIWQQLNNVTAADFSPDNKKVAYLDTSNNLMNKSLTSMKTKPAKIMAITQKDFDLEWLSADKILLVPKPSYKFTGQIWSINIKGLVLSLIAEGPGLIINWADDGKSGIKSVSLNKKSPEMSLIDDKGAMKASLDFKTTPDKCLTKQTKIYCAIPQGHNALVDPSLPDDYLKRAVYFRDSIYVIDMVSNSYNQVFDGNEPVIDATHLSLVGNALLFINRYDNRLYKLEL